jgi:hypothetical protein
LMTTLSYMLIPTWNSLTAGHETTAHSLAFAAAFLGLYQNVQEKLYSQIQEVIPDSSQLPVGPSLILRFISSINANDRRIRMSTASPMLPLYSTKPFVCFQWYTSHIVSETSKQSNQVRDPFPRLQSCPRQVPKTPSLGPPTPKESQWQYQCHEGLASKLPQMGFIETVRQNVKIDWQLILIRPSPAAKYWDEPDAFKPERFLGEWPKHAFIPFSAGVRSCIGRRYVWASYRFLL